MINVLFKYPLKKRLGCVEQHSPANELYSLLRGGFMPIISSTDTFSLFVGLEAGFCDIPQILCAESVYLRLSL